MTISYNADVAAVGSFGVFWKMLFRWKGSIYKLVLPDMAIYIIFYYALNIPYRYAMSDHNRALFEQVVTYCHNMTNSIPMSFVLGFYVTIIVQRWWEQYICMPWPDALAVYVSTNIQGTDERGRVIRRTILRYVNLAFVYSMSQISTQVQKRFPTLDHLVEAGMLMESEKKIFESMNRKTPHLKYWMPLVWAGSIVVKARKEGRILDDFAVKTLVDSINEFCFGLARVFSYDWISIPLVYTQTVTLAVYTFFMAEMMGRQFVKGEGKVDLLIPIFSFISFFFYMGWLRVAETLCNPFGDDDDDFELNWMIDRNLQISYIIVDDMHKDFPQLIQDPYLDALVPKERSCTISSDTISGQNENSANHSMMQDITAVTGIIKSKENRHALAGESSNSTTLIDPSLPNTSPPSLKSMLHPSSTRNKTLPASPSGSILILNPRPWVGVKSTTSELRQVVVPSGSLLKRSVNTFAKVFTNRVMHDAVSLASKNVQNGDRKPTSTVAKAGEGAVGSVLGLDRLPSQNADHTEADRQKPSRPVVTPMSSTATAPTPSIESTIVEVQQLNHRAVDKETPKFLPDEYDFLVVRMNDGAEANHLQASKTGSENNMLATHTLPVSPAAISESSGSLGSTTESGLALQVGMLSKIMIALMDTFGVLYSPSDPALTPPTPMPSQLGTCDVLPHHGNQDAETTESATTNAGAAPGSAVFTGSEAGADLARQSLLRTAVPPAQDHQVSSGGLRATDSAEMSAAATQPPNPSQIGAFSTLRDADATMSNLATRPGQSDGKMTGQAGQAEDGGMTTEAIPSQPGDQLSPQLYQGTSGNEELLTQLVDDEIPRCQIQSTSAQTSASSDATKSSKSDTGTPAHRPRSSASGSPGPDSTAHLPTSHIPSSSLQASAIIEPQEMDPPYLDPKRLPENDEPYY